MLAVPAPSTASTRVAEVRASSERGVRALPFVYVFGRSDFTISYFGANVYPENVTVGLEQPPIDQWVTGKFVLEAREDDDRNRYLSIVVELAPDVPPERRQGRRRSPSRSCATCCA